MVSSSQLSTNLVYNLKLSSVGPSRVTGTDIFRVPTGMDLAMKSHYLKGLYFFGSRACEGLNIARFKEGLFYWCNEYYMVCGRYRRSSEEGGGRPVMKCNDCGVRVAEAQCDLTVEEWMEMIRNNKDGGLLNDLLIYHHPLGPDLFFSPPCYMQLTKFKCGGMSFGVSWAHILGDVFSAADSIAKWTQYLAGRRNSDGPLTYVPLPRPQPPSELATWPLSINQVDTVGDHWITPNSSKMAKLSFFLSPSHASHLQAQVGGGFPLFESICAVVWHCIAKVRAGLEPNTVTICKKDPGYVPKAGSVSNLGQVVSSVTAESPVRGSGFTNLASLLMNTTADERDLIDAALEKDDGVMDYILYGANLTFVNFEEANLYGLEWNGIGPELVCFGIQGVGDRGAVLVVPWRRSNNNNNNNNNTGENGNLMGRIVTVVVAESEVDGLKLELKKSGLPV